ncbi:MAG: M48 family metallopeptidase [Oscillospiraceae bacterium]|nr:M48 family metallopeptidase [Oscillospiraceae bacterium]
MIEDVRKNKFKSGVIVAIFLLVVTLIIYFVCYAFDLGSMAIVIALIFSIIATWSSYYFSDKIVLSINKARPATPQEDKKIVDILDALMVSSGLKTKPRLYVVDSLQMNAFATGRNPEHAVICVTTGLLNKLEYYELEGVIAHELAHVKNYDILLSAVVSVMVGLVVMLSHMFFFGGGRRSGNREGGNQILLLIGLVFLILSPIFMSLMQLAISRKREYLADATSVQFTRNPDGLISALRKLDTDTAELTTANQATASMYIANPFKKGKNAKRDSSSFFSTHPSIADRIKALENIR